MAEQVALVPLVCIKCQAPLPANPNEVVWVCAQCKQGLRLDEEKGLVAQEIYFSAGIAPNGRGKPFWVADGQVAVQRQTYSGNDNRDAALFWSQPQRFFIPAYACGLVDMVAAGTNLLYKPPVLQPGPVAAFEPVIISAEDASAFAEFIVVGIEAGRRDKMKQIQVSISLSQPMLWILP